MYKIILNCLDMFHEQMRSVLKTENLTEDEALDYFTLEEYSNKYSEYVTKTAEIIYKMQKEDLLDYYNIIIEDRNNYLSHINNIWGDALVHLRACFEINVEICVAFNEYLSKLPPEQLSVETNIKGMRFEALRALHARALHVFSEIKCLIENGFADGAFARWRTIYEIWIISEFIGRNDELTAKSYMDEHDKTSHDYEWARVSKCFSEKQRITLTAIEKHCGIDKLIDGWKSEHYLSHKIVHASSQGTFNRLSSCYEDGFLIGNHIYGLHVPAGHAIFVLWNITKVYLGLIPTPISSFGCAVLKKWSDSTVNLFVDIASKLETSIEQSQDDTNFWLYIECYKPPILFI